MGVMSAPMVTVTVVAADAVLLYVPLDAVSEQLYDTPDFNPDTVIGELVPVAVLVGWPAAVQVAV